MRARCDVMADRSDREQGQPNRCPRRHSLMNRMGPCSRTPSGPAVSQPTASTARTEDCTRPMPLRQFISCNADIHRRHRQAGPPCPFGSPLPGLAWTAADRIAKAGSQINQCYKHRYNQIVPSPAELPAVAVPLFPGSNDVANPEPYPRSVDNGHMYRNTMPTTPTSMARIVYTPPFA